MRKEKGRKEKKGVKGRKENLSSITLEEINGRKENGRKEKKEEGKEKGGKGRKQNVSPVTLGEINGRGVKWIWLYC